MKALVKKFPKVGLWMEEVPEPTTGDNEVKIKIHKTAICGTDLHIYNWNDWAQKTIKTPMTIGHEYVGEIVEVGKNVPLTLGGVRDRLFGLGRQGARFGMAAVGKLLCFYFHSIEFYWFFSVNDTLFSMSACGLSIFGEIKKQGPISTRGQNQPVAFAYCAVPDR